MTGTDEAHTLADGLFQNLVKNASEREGSVLTPFNVRVTAAAVSAVAALVSVFFGDGLHMFLGLLLGCGIAELLFLQNERSIEQQLDNPEKAGMIARRDYLVRLVVRIAAVVVGWLNPFTNIIGVIIGLLSITIAIYILTFVSAWQLKKEEQAAAARAGDAGTARPGEVPGQGTVPPAGHPGSRTGKLFRRNEPRARILKRGGRGAEGTECPGTAEAGTPGTPER